MKNTVDQPKPQSVWQKTNYANLIRYEPKGTYYARIRVRGKLILRSLKTKAITVAKLKLGDLEKEEHRRAESQNAPDAGKMTVADALSLYRQRLKTLVEQKVLKPRSRTYREECVIRLRRAWPELESMDVRRVTKADCLAFAPRPGTPRQHLRGLPAQAGRNQVPALTGAQVWARRPAGRALPGGSVGLL